MPSVSRPAESTQADITFHAFADIFPMMDDAVLAELAADIKAESQREPIYLWQDQIIDGRNRWRACRIAGVEPVIKRIEFPGGEAEALAYVVSRNLKRRHLSVTQRSDVARKLATLPHGVRSDTARAVSAAITQGQAAKALDVSVDSVQRARVVYEHGSPELIAAVESGKVGLRKAAETVRAARAAPEPVLLTFEHSAKVADVNAEKALKDDERYRDRREAALAAMTPVLHEAAIEAWLKTALDSQRGNIAIKAFNSILSNEERARVIEALAIHEYPI